MPRTDAPYQFEENFPGSDITAEEWEFLKAIELYQRRFDRRFPTWVEVLLVVHCLGYRKVEDPKPVTPRPTRKEKKR